MLQAFFLLFFALILSSCAHALPSRIPTCGQTPEQRVRARHQFIESATDSDLSAVDCVDGRVGGADQKNCENMIGHVVMPLGIISNLVVPHSNGATFSYCVPFATTEGALIASISRGAKALAASEVSVSSRHIGATRAPAFKIKNGYTVEKLAAWIEDNRVDLYRAAKKTSSHLKVLNVQIMHETPYLFLRCSCDTDCAMGMNMVTIATRAMVDEIVSGVGAQFVECVTLSSNVCTDKKPSRMNARHGRGYRVSVRAALTTKTLVSVLKTTKDQFYDTWHAKCVVGSRVAGLLGNNCHVANVVAGLYIALGQDPAHVVEGSLATLTCRKSTNGVEVTLDMPAVMVGIVGGGTTLPAQKQLLSFLNLDRSGLHPCTAFAELVATTALAGEISLLAALSSGHLASAHKSLARGGQR